MVPGLGYSMLDCPLLSDSDRANLNDKDPWVNVLLRLSIFTKAKPSRNPGHILPATAVAWPVTPVNFKPNETIPHHTELYQRLAYIWAEPSLVSDVPMLL
jgi:hypothetical protein